MELVENDIMNIRDVADIGGLLGYFQSHLGWNIGVESFDDIEDVMYGFNANDLGLKEEEFAKVKSLYQLPPLEEDQQWGIFCVEFNTEKFSVTALRKILSRLVPTRRNATMHSVWDEKDLLFLCFWGTGGNRTICAAHFEQQANALSQVRTIHCSPAVEDAAVLAHFEKKLGKLQWPIDVSDYESWHGAWVEAFDTYWGEVIKTSAELADRMANVAKDLRKRILDAMEVETDKGFVHCLFEKVKANLVHNLKESDFADMYAQMIVYGLFSARCLDKTPDTFSVEEAISLIPNTNPFLKNMMRDCCAVKQGGGVSFDELGVADVVDMFAKVDAAKIAADFGKQSGGGREDPVIYFYEEFLKAYDKEQKVKCGEFYTPMPVVGFMVRAVDHILRTQFNMPDGLATEAKKTIKIVPEGKKNAVKKEVPAIQILDPALGTGTFLREIILNIYRTFCKKHLELKGAKLDEAWSRYVDRNVLPRLNGFELMMAPYAIAHMKLAMVLQDTGYDFKGNKRLQVYLTNSLEEPGNSDKQMTFFDDPLAAESVAANNVKKNTGINIVIGNPPYSGISQNNGEWITKMVNEYKYTNGVYFEEKKHWLNDDYVKFIRLGQEFVMRGGSGVLAFITNHKFLDNVTFRAMRWNLLRAFDEIYILDLHGDTEENKALDIKDENVFDIKKGVSISLFVKNASKRSDGLAKVFRADMIGMRDLKMDKLSSWNFTDVKWQKVIYSHPYYFFIQRTEAGREVWEAMPSIKDLFPQNTMGVLTARDFLVVDIDKVKLLDRIKTFCSPNFSEQDIRNMFFGTRKEGKYPPGDTRGWSLSAARIKIRSYEHDTIIRKIAYRPYDMRHLYYSPAMVDWGREKGMKHLMHPNIALLTCRQISEQNWYHVNVTDCIVDDCFVSNKTKERGYGFPLYLYQEFNNEMQKVPNLNPEIVKKIAAALGENPTPEDIFNYIYAVLHSPSYREKYKEFLKIDFPRIPYPTDAATFHALAALGAQLVAIHTMKDFDEADDVAFDNAGGCEVVKVTRKGGAVYINKESRFTSVDDATWSQYIGGYQPLQKWLKDRKGRKLSDADISHYKRIVRALRRTAALMSEIDKLPVCDK